MCKEVRELGDAGTVDVVTTRDASCACWAVVRWDGPTVVGYVLCGAFGGLGRVRGRCLREGGDGSRDAGCALVCVVGGERGACVLDLGVEGAGAAC